MSEKPESAPTPEAHLDRLKSKDAAERKAAVEDIATQSTLSLEIVAALEKMVVKDRSKAVRESALNALLSPGCQQAQRGANSNIPLYVRRHILNQISKWEQDGLLTPQQKRLLSQRYTFDIQPAKDSAKSKSAPAPAPIPKRSLTEIIFSESTILTFLYLGAFFMIGASYVFAFAFEGIPRVVILLLLAGLFFGASIGLKKPLPQASFVMFIIFSILLPINAGVIQDAVNLHPSLEAPYWIIFTVVLTTCWAWGTWLYGSRLFSVLVLGGATQIIFLIGDWANASTTLTLFLWQLLLIGSLGAIKALTIWKDQKFAVPAHLFQQTSQLWLLFISFISMFDNLDQGWWLLTALTWVIASAGYVLSEKLHKYFWGPFMAVGTLLVVPTFILEFFSPESNIYIITNWIWGTIFLIIAEAFSDKEKAKRYLLPAYITAAILHILTNIAGGFETETFRFTLLFFTTLLYGGITFYKLRDIPWIATLSFGLLTYFSAFRLPLIDEYNFYFGLILLWPTLAILLGEIYTRRTNQPKIWGRWLLAFGLGLAGITSLYLIGSGYSDPGRAAVGYLILSLFSIGYAFSYPAPSIGYIPAFGFTLTLLFTLIHYDQDLWLYPYLGLSLAYFIPGFIALYQNKKSEWYQVLRTSGLVLGSLVALSSPFQAGPAAIVTTTVVAALFTLEAFRQKDVWLALPANLLYILAYFMVLTELKIDQPQFYSVGAAVMGMIMHYLLIKSGSNFGAFIAGMVSQIILLSTSYYQLASTGKGIYFFALILQAIAVIAYGLVIRSRSLLITPIGFTVLAVLTVMFDLLDSNFIIFVLCCLGIILIVGGVTALFMRDKVFDARDKIRERISDWQA